MLSLRPRSMAWTVASSIASPHGLWSRLELLESDDDDDDEDSRHSDGSDRHTVRGSLASWG
jgi:hypothetical protein